MADSTDWRNSVSASERYDNIQKIQKAAPDQNAFSIETQAYQNSTSKEEYISAINLASCSLPHQQQSPTPEAAAIITTTTTTTTSPPYHPASPEQTTPSSPGIKIGPYQSCHYVASGITSEVYRTISPKDDNEDHKNGNHNNQLIALKVITNPSVGEPHNPRREAKILSSLSHPNVIPLLETFVNPSTQNFVLAFPYHPLTLSSFSLPLPRPLLLSVFRSLFSALAYLHSQSIIHRDVKPSAILISPSSKLSSANSTPPSYDVFLSDFGTSWHPSFPSASEPSSSQKILDVGTGPYRSPEALFGDRAYGPAVDVWAAGCTLAECLTGRSLFECPPSNEDGNQLGLILSIFRTLGTPTEKTWPEAKRFKTKPFGIYRVFEGRSWREILRLEDGGIVGGGDGDGDGDDTAGERWSSLVEGCVRYESGSRLKAREVVEILEGWGDGGMQKK